MPLTPVVRRRRCHAQPAGRFVRPEGLGKLDRLGREFLRVLPLRYRILCLPPPH